MLQLIFLLIYNIPRIFFMRMRYGTRVNIHWSQRISPYCAIKVYDKGKLSIGSNCQIPAGCDITILRQGELSIGKRVITNKYCMVSCLGSIKIGDCCLIGPGVKIFDNNHRYTKEYGATQELSIGSIVIGKNCWIASNVVILKGAEIGDNCVIGAGCVVKGKIPSGSIVRPNIVNIIEEIRP